MKAVILAGGLGTRLGRGSTPKVLTEVAGQPVLERQLRLLELHGASSAAILASHGVAEVRDFISARGPSSLDLSVVVEDPPMGTAGAVRLATEESNEPILVLYGDLVVNMDLRHLFEWHGRSRASATLVVHPNDHPYDSDLVEVDHRWRVERFHSKPHEPHADLRNLVSAAVYVIEPDVRSWIPDDRPSDFGQDVFPAMLAAGASIAAYPTTEYVKDMGTPDRLVQVAEHVRNGLDVRMERRSSRPVAFLDRDGVINADLDNLADPATLELLPGVAEAIAMLNRNAYLVVVVTNQPVIAKGWATFDTMRAIHDRMEWLLGKEHAFVDRVYLCPHHPEKGFRGEVAELKIPCECRKPAPGLFFEALRDFSVDLTRSFVVGDKATDLVAGWSADVPNGYLVASPEGAPGLTPPPGRTMEVVGSLLEAVKRALSAHTASTMDLS
jgi:histidinol-phosphate phosphatase family protein